MAAAAQFRPLSDSWNLSMSRGENLLSPNHEPFVRIALDWQGVRMAAHVVDRERREKERKREREREREERERERERERRERGR